MSAGDLLLCSSYSLVIKLEHQRRDAAVPFSPTIKGLVFGKTLMDIRFMGSLDLLERIQKLSGKCGNTDYDRSNRQKLINAPALLEQASNVVAA